MSSLFSLRSIAALLLLLIGMIAGCDNTVDLQFSSPFDPESPTYLPAKPNGLSAFPEGDSSIYLTWTDNSLNEDGFIIELMIGLSGDFIPVDTVGQDVTEFHHVKNLEQNIEYNYRVAAFKENRVSGRTNIHSLKFYMAVPNKPSITVVSSTSCKVMLSYSGFFKQYRIERSVNGGQFLPLATVGQDRTFYLDQSIDTTNSYSYRYSVSTGRNESVTSAAVSMEYSFSDAEIIRTLDIGLSVHSITFSPDGSRIAATGLANALKVWNSSTGALVHDLSFTGSAVAIYSWPYQCVFSADGTLLAAHCETLNATGIRIWNAASGTAVQTLGIAGRSFAFSTNKADLYIGGMNGTVTVRNIAADSTTYEWTAHGFNNDVTLVHPVKNGTQIVSGSFGSPEYLQFWNIGPVGVQRSFSGYNYEFYTLSPDETLLSGGPFIRDVNTGNLVRTFSSSVTGQMCFVLNNTHVIEKKYDGKLAIYSISSGATVWSKTLTRADVYTFPAIAASPTQNIFATASSQANKIDIWVMKNSWKIF